MLQRDLKGQLCCSVDTAGVRPFWGQALRYAGSSLATIYLISTLGVFGLLRLVGYPITFRQVAWPPAWAEFSHIQSQYFAAKANRSFADQKVPEAMAALALAYQLDPKNYALGLLLAQLWQTGQPVFADRVYERLLNDHPEKRAATLAAWYYALLLRGDFKAVIPLATQALQNDPARPNAWIYAILFALQREPNLPALENLARNHDLTNASKSVFVLEHITQTSTPEISRAALLRPESSPPTSYLEYYRPKRLIELGYPQDALRLLDENSAGTTHGDEAIALRLDAYSALGWTREAQSATETLLNSPPSARTVELLCAHLVRHPNAALLNRLEKSLRSNPLPVVEINYSATMALLCATGAAGKMDAFREFAETSRKIAGRDVRALGVVENFFADPKSALRVESSLPALQPLSIDLTYAMLERYYRPRPTMTPEK